MALGRLMVIVPDRISDLAAKGEITERYYNPGAAFDEVHLVLTNDDAPPPDAVDALVGGVPARMYNLPSGRGALMAGSISPLLVRSWLRRAVALAEHLDPDLVRCHGAQLNAMAARAINRSTGTPYVVSVHGLPEHRTFGGRGGVRAQLLGRTRERVARRGVAGAAAVLAVYEALVPWLAELGGPTPEVAYNVVCPDGLVRQQDRTPTPVLRVVNVGRHITGKLPLNLLRAVAELRDVHVTLIGDGPLTGELRAEVDRLAIGDRCRFEAAVGNRALCGRLAEFDVFALHNEHHGIPKSCLEAMLAAVPVVANRLPPGVAPELDGDVCVLVEDTADGYRRALELLRDPEARRRVGDAGRARADERWSPHATERRVVAIYERVVGADGQRRRTK